MKKEEIIAKLTELNVDFDPTSRKADLMKLLEENSKEEEKSDQASDEVTPSGIIVKDPNLFRPKVLPLVVILPPTANKAQQAAAKVINAYAYSHPDKWNKWKKQECLDYLDSLKNAPDPVENPDGPKISVGSVLPK